MTKINISGLSSNDVQSRIAQGQTNRFKARVGRTYWQIIRTNIFNIFNILLFIMLLMVLIMGDYITVVFAGFSIMTNALIGTVQEINAKRKLDSLANLASPYVTVRRNNQDIKIHNQDIVKDDIIAVYPGDRLAVDGNVVSSDSLEIDESHLTGESDPIYKQIDDKLYSGAFCITGTGWMRATQVGAHSTVNQLSTIAKIYKVVLTPTQQKIVTIVQFSLMILAIFGPMVFIALYQQGWDFLEIMRSTVVFTTSLVSQGLILATVLSLTIGAVKISRHQTLIQRVNAVESMANVTTLCFDKTGTITQNKLNVQQIIPLDDTVNVRLKLRTYISNLAYQNSTAAALDRHLETINPSEAIKIREIPFSSSRKWAAIEFEGETLLLGAPERLLKNWHSQQVELLSKQGLRVLAFATTDKLNEQSITTDLTPLALVTIADQIRDDIKETLNAFKQQNVKIKVISGDNLETVKAIAAQAGLSTESTYTGDMLEDMNGPQFNEAVKRASVFARIEPSTKQRIISTLKEQGEYVAMVGDGVNDVPALKNADLAIVMNDGSQISKDIADIVLLNNALSTLPLAFYEGTEITQTIYGSTKIFLTRNLFNTSLFIYVLLMGLPFPITPVQTSWAAFGTMNIPGGLMALGLLRPKFIKDFRRDVMDYVITCGVTGGVAMALLYVCTYHYAGSDIEIARSTTTSFFLFYGLMMVWHIHGVDILQPATFLQYKRGMIITSILTGGAWIAASLFPDIFEYHWPPLEIMLLTFLIFLLSMMVVSIGMSNRGLLHRMYSLFGN